MYGFYLGKKIGVQEPMRAFSDCHLYSDQYVINYTK